jgi:type IV secretion system protein TrbL
MGLCSVADPVSCISGLSGGVAKQIAGSAFSAIAHDFAKAADSAVNWLWGQMSAATAVTLGGAGWQTDLGITVALAVTIGLGLFVIQVIASTIRREPGDLVRAGRGLLVAFVAGGAAIAVTNLLLAASDGISAGIVRVGAGTTIQGLGRQILGPSTLSGITNAAAVMLVSFAMIFATVVVWFALTLRKLLIVVAAVFAPVAFTGALADITSSWVRKWVEMTVALIVSKIVLVVIFVVGLGVLEGGAGESAQSGIGHGAQTVTQVVVGVMILLLAGFAPWLAIKLVHFAGDSFHAIHASAGSVRQGAQTAIDVPRKMTSMGQRASNSVSSSSSSQGAGKSAAQNGNGAADASSPNGAKKGAGTGGASSAKGATGTSGAAAGGGAAGGGGTAGGGAVAGVVNAGQTAKRVIDSSNAKVADATGHATPSSSSQPAPRSGAAESTPAAAGTSPKASSNGSARPASNPSQ